MAAPAIELPADTLPNKIERPRMFAAHLSTDAPPHELSEHLTKVAARAAANAEFFGSAGLASLAGLWHDLGKYNPDWQEYLRQAATNPEDAHLEQEKAQSRGPNHSSAGALYALKWLRDQGCSEKEANVLARILAYPIMGHHAGLADFDAGEGGLHKRLHEPSDHLEKAMCGNPPPHILHPDTPPVKDIYTSLSGRNPAFLIRMLFSCLVDADFLDTESYMSPDKQQRRRGYPVLQELDEALQGFLDEKSRASLPSPVNVARAEVLEACRRQAEKPPGFFSLVVPTGGGKTLSSLAFALKHALRHKKRRVIYAIPYTSIIEQTADVFRGVFKDFENSLVEHHSNVADSPSSQESTCQRLASENWDAPLIVTTTVQLFESLYASRSGRCRKLHNIAGSVIILDEAHLMPTGVRFPILHALHQLVSHYGVTIVLCTATPTGIENLKKEKIYIPKLQPIIENPEALYKRLERVHVEIRKDIVQDWGTLASELAQHPQVLCIVNRRDDCRDLHAAMPAESIHLSALMCAEHRSTVIKNMKQNLEKRNPVRVISTQLVEAGVDIDFPVVYRALAGLDSIAQAAGRCNREGQLEEDGRLIVFRPARGAPKGSLKQAEETTAEILRLWPDANVLSPDTQKEYFKRFYGRCEDGDRYNILTQHLKENQEFTYQFRTTAECFRIVEDLYRPVIVRYENDELLKQLYREKPEKWLLRKTQRYTVSIPPPMLKTLMHTGAIREIIPGLFVQDIAQAPNLYHAQLGLMPEHHNEYPPEDLVA